MLDVRAANVLVSVGDVDIAGAGSVGGARELANERRVLDERVDPEHLARLEIQAHFDGEAGVTRKAVTGFGHGAQG